MKLSLSHRKIPELSGVLKEDQELVGKNYYKKSFENMKTWMAIFLFKLFQVGLGEFKYNLKIDFPDIHGRYIYHPITFLCWLIELLTLFQVIVPVARSYIEIDVEKYCANWIYR